MAPRCASSRPRPSPAGRRPPHRLWPFAQPRGSRSPVAAARCPQTIPAALPRSSARRATARRRSAPHSPARPDRTPVPGPGRALEPSRLTPSSLLPWCLWSPCVPSSGKPRVPTCARRAMLDPAERAWALRSAARECLHVSARSADVRYTGSMSNTFVQSMAHNFEQALRLMEAALTDCPDELWPADLWPDEAPTGPGPYGGLHGSAPWFLGYHSLLTLDYDLAAEFEPWAPPQPFYDNTYAFPNRVFTKVELLEYVDWCRGRARQTLDGLTEEMAERPLPSAHRYHGTLFGVIVGGIPLHVVEHASQIRQFLTASGVKVQPMPGDRGYIG